jgi:serine/threonine-protein kinase
MSLATGNRLGAYEIVALLGKGGMGEVWKARDPRLGRDVAIKVSAQQFTDRFEREARAIAALNHANICALYDVGPNYLVMELIEGPTLAERIRQGPIPLEEALAIAGQIANALEAAHEKGIAHRDLKPANIKIRPDGSVKVLDLGLAKSANQPEVTHDSPTMLSVSGMILGTAGYMSPEQARGQEVDKRADIWAFGVVLYEMLTAQRLFDGGTISDSLADILTKEPDLALVPEKTRRLPAACLEKDPRKRLRDIGDWTRLLETQVGQASTEGAPSVQRAKGLPYKIAAGVLAVLLAGLALVHFRETPPALPVVRLQLTTPGSVSAHYLALSPDGRMLAFLASNGGTNADQLWVRSLDSLDARPLAGTNGTSFPFWSPDSASLGFSRVAV